jgi:hypothetical protein
LASTEKTKTGSFIVPATAALGVTRMRVSMQYNSGPTACGNYTYGEVEDYCVQVIEGNAVRTLSSNLKGAFIYPNPFQKSFHVSFELTETSPVQLKLHSLDGRTIWKQSFNNLGPGLQNHVIYPKIAAGMYVLEIKDKDSVQYLNVIKG